VWTGEAGRNNSRWPVRYSNSSSVHVAPKKIYAHARVYAPGVIKGVNDGHGKSHNPLLCLRIYRSSVMPRPTLYRVPPPWTSDGVTKGGSFGNSRRCPLSLHFVSHLLSRRHVHTYTRTHNIHARTRNNPWYKEKKMYQTLATAVNDFHIFPFRPTNKYLEKRKKHRREWNKLLFQ